MFRGHLKSSGVRPALTLAALAAVGCAAASEDEAAAYRGRLLQEPRPKVDFTLTDTEGQPFRFVEETEGKVALVFFGYTYCPDICPVHMANIGAVLSDFPYELRRQFRVVFISADPERDTPERMREWLDRFDSSFVGLRGSLDEVNEIAQQMGLPPAVHVETDSGSGYVVGHSANVVAFTPDDKAHIAYPFGTRQADWAHDLPKLVNETWDGPS